MKRRSLLEAMFTAALLPTLNACGAASQGSGQGGLARAATQSPAMGLSNYDWREILPADRYAVLFEEATERPGSSPLNDEDRDGTYICAACHLPLFESAHKYDSGTGWPSFTQPIAGSMGTKADYKLFVRRTEYHCIRCGGHQGHVFGDGPPPRRERWCNNGLALMFVAEGEPLPALRG